MDNRNNILDRLLIGAKSAKPVLKVEDAFELIKNHEVKSLPRFNLKFFTIMGTSILIIAAFVGGMLMMEPAQKTDTVVSEPEKSSKQEIHELRKEPAELPTTVNSEKPAEPQLRKNTAGIAVIDTPKPVKQEAIIFEAADSLKTDLKIQEEILSTKKLIDNESDSGLNSEIICQEDPGYIRLNESELKQLGIVVKEGIVAFEQLNTSFMGKNIQFIIDTRTGAKNMRYTGASKSIKQEQLYPQIVTNCNSHIEFLIGTEDYKPVESKPEDYLPVRVDVPQQSEYYIFWYKKSGKLLELFPERIQQELKINPNKYTVVFKSAHFVRSPFIPEIPSNIPAEKINLAADSQLVTASPALLKKLKIEITEKEIILKRFGIEVKLGQVSRYYSIKIPVSESDNPKKLSLKKLKPYYISPSFYYANDKSKYASLLRSKETETEDNFFNKRHSLMALKIAHPTVGEMLFWYPLADDLLAELPIEEAKKIKAYASDKKHGLLLVTATHPAYYQHLDELLTDTKPTSEAVNALSLDSLSLLKLGIQVKTDYISHVFVAEGRRPMRLIYNKHGVMSDMVSESTSPEAAIAGKYLRLVTDDLGQSKRAVADVDAGLQEVNVLVPVLVRSGKDYNFSDKVNFKWRPDLIFWFEPTEEFLTLLPKEIADEIRKNTRSVFHPEKTEILSSEKNGSCNYVEVCRNKKGIIEEHSIFPNPANTGTNISIDAPAALQLNVKLTAVNGALVKESNYSFDGKGKGKLHFSTKDVPPGIYLLIITSDQGDAIYERLVIIK